MTLTGESLLTPDGPIATRLSGYEARPAQLEMARLVDELIAEDRERLLVEAGTGVGKSLAYLAPALASGIHTVVATGTKALQDQLANDDVPMVIAALEALEQETPRVEVVKGRHNYLCHLRFERVASAPELPGVGAGAWAEEIEGWLRRTSTGERSELSALADDDPRWSQIDAGAETCVGSSCPHRERCFIVRLRERARAADLIITNHHLLMADEALRLGQRFGDIPEHAELLPDHDLLIVDEAHALPGVATDAFSADVSSAQLERLARDVRQAAQPLARELKRKLEPLAAAAEEQARVTLRALAPAGGEDRRTIEPGVLDAQGRRALNLALDQLEALSGALRKHAEETSAFEALAQRAQRLGKTLDFVAAAGDSSYVYFAEKRRRHVRVAAAPIVVAQPLAETVFRSGRQVVLTSATLCTDRGFEPMRRLLGLTDDEGVVERQIPSPFPYQQLARLYLPQEPIIPDSASHLDRLADEMEALCRAAAGGCFLLFTSYRVLDAIYAELSERLDLRLLRQGEAPRRRLLETFRTDGNAVLFGTSSFWEGVDVRGDALRLVAIDRLPFTSPRDPLYAARGRLLEERGERPFTALALPQAILELKQGIGRLVRSSSDRGVIALLDGRVQTKPYGRRFLKALPPAPRVNTIAEVEAFFAATA